MQHAQTVSLSATKMAALEKAALTEKVNVAGTTLKKTLKNEMGAFADLNYYINELEDSPFKDNCTNMYSHWQKNRSNYSAALITACTKLETAKQSKRRKELQVTAYNDLNKAIDQRYKELLDIKDSIIETDQDQFTLHAYNYNELLEDSSKISINITMALAGTYKEFSITANNLCKVSMKALDLMIRAHNSTPILPSSKEEGTLVLTQNGEEHRLYVGCDFLKEKELSNKPTVPTLMFAGSELLEPQQEQDLLLCVGDHHFVPKKEPTMLCTGLDLYAEQTLSFPNVATADPQAALLPAPKKIGETVDSRKVRGLQFLKNCTNN